MRKLVIGCGYLGERVAAAWQAQGHTVLALTRSKERAQQFKSRGWEPIVGDVTDPNSLGGLAPVDTVLYAAGLDRSSGKSQREVYVDGLRNVLRNILDRMRRIVYISSSSVYGQDDGSWVDETSPCVPASANGQVCLEAENVVWEFFPPSVEQGDRATGGQGDRKTGRVSLSPCPPVSLSPCPPVGNTLRLSGIYGPGRLIARAESLRAGTPLTGNPDAWLNLIHVDDAVGAVLACESLAKPGATYLVTDNRALPRKEFYAAMCRLIGAPPPVFQESAEVGGLNKRCSNRRLREELGVSLRYPTIEEGLPQALGLAEQ